MKLAFETEVEHILYAYPKLQIETIERFANEGQFSDVLLINKAIVFRFPRNARAAHSMAQEVTLLKFLQGKVGLPIPHPQYSRADSENGELIFMGYRMLPGVPLRRDTLTNQEEAIIRRFAQQLAQFLQVLHQTAVAGLALNLSAHETRAEWAERYKAFQETLYPHMRPDARAQVKELFEAALNDSSLWDFDTVLRHGDFGMGNILYDPHTMSITGVIDFACAGLGDPAQDVGALWSLGDDFMDCFFASYPEMQNATRRIQFIRSTYALQQAYYALRDGNQAAFEEGIRDYV